MISALGDIVGTQNVLTGAARTARYTTGYRDGGAMAAAVVLPGSLIEMWRCLQVVVAANGVIIMQAANTGLTGGSTPCAAGYSNRPAVVVGTKRLAGVHLLEGGAQVICLPGTSLDELERVLEPLGREPHSVIGSTCLGASVIGGVCNNSGGALVRRGPAYTEFALYARLREDGQLHLVNELGIELGASPEEMLHRLSVGGFAAQGCESKDYRCASDTDYAQRVRAIDKATPARYNADPDRLCGASGSAGRVAVFAVRLDTFPKDESSSVFYIGTNDPKVLTRFRRDVLGSFAALPVSAEYMDRETFKLAERYGKDGLFLIRTLGTRRLPRLFDLKSRFDAIAAKLGARPAASDRLLQAFSRLLPAQVPAPLRRFRDAFRHHLIVRAADEGIAEMRTYLSNHIHAPVGGWRECEPVEAERALLLRFVAAGAAMRYSLVHRRQISGLVALDVALPRNSLDWDERLPADLSSRLVGRFCYAHFLCHVFHRDYVVRAGCDPEDVRRRLLERFAEQGAEYPAEHNVGHQYPAKPQLSDFYRALDPLNVFNPGIGQTSRNPGWA